jgi:hypothetical protein
MQLNASKNGHRNPPGFRLSRNTWGRLMLTDDAGREHVGVEPVRGFPISDPEHGISICDAEGHELAWVESLGQLPGPVRQILEEELARREFMPVIRRIVQVSAPVEPSEWEVETDRGGTKFVLTSEDHVRRLDGHRAMIIDSQGIRYLIPDTSRLDSVSRRILERYL